MGIGLHLAIYSCRCEGKAIKSCTARIVSNYSAFRKRIAWQKTGSSRSAMNQRAAGICIAALIPAISPPAAAPNALLAGSVVPPNDALPKC